MEVVLGFFKSKPGATISDAKKALGFSYPRLIRARDMLTRIGLLSRYTKVPKAAQIDDPAIRQIVSDLENTLLTELDITKRLKVSGYLVRDVCQLYKCRTEEATRAMRSKGIRFESLEMPVKQIPEHEKLRIIGENRDAIEGMLDDFKGKPAEEQIHRKVYAAVKMALRRYSPYLMSEKHFVMLVARRAIYDHAVLGMRSIGLKFKNPTMGKIKKKNLRTGKNPHETEAARFVENELPGITALINEKIRNEQAAQDIRQDVALRIMNEFTPGIRDTKAWVRGIVDKAAKKFFGGEIGERWKRANLERELRTQDQVFQNKPRGKRRKE